MQSINSIVNQITSDCSDVRFSTGEDFYWRSEGSTVYHPPILSTEDLLLLLHEIGHAKLGHTSYSSDVHLLDMEREAWQYALSTLVPTYGVSQDVALEASEDALDSYREWLHRRSTCPSCHAIGLESTKSTYRCLACNQEWRVNEARSCQLRRYKKMA